MWLQTLLLLIVLAAVIFCYFGLRRLISAATMAQAKALDHRLNNIRGDIESIRRNIETHDL